MQGNYQQIKKKMIGHDELGREREERIERLKKDFYELKEAFEKLEIEHGALKINHSKIMEQYQQSAIDLDDTTQKLHLTNKTRHETEIKLGEEIEKVRSLQDIIKIKEETLAKRSNEIEELDKKVIDLERQNETLEVKKQGIERQAELTKK